MLEGKRPTPDLPLWRAFPHLRLITRGDFPPRRHETVSAHALRIATPSTRFEDQFFDLAAKGHGKLVAQTYI